MAITSQDAALAGFGPPLSFFKGSVTSEGAGTFHNHFRLAGFPVAAANAPAFNAGSGYACDNNTVGCFPFVNPSAGQNKHLAQVAAVCGTIGTLIFYDRLWQCSGFVTTTAPAAQTITTPGTIPARDQKGTSDGAGVELWLEVYGVPGATAATWTVSYTNQAGVSGRTATYAHPANAETAGQMMQMTLQSGDTGVRSVESFACSVSSGTAGNIGITLLRRVAMIPLSVANVSQLFDFYSVGMPRLYDGTCLTSMVLCTTTNTGNLFGNIIYTEG